MNPNSRGFQFITYLFEVFESVLLVELALNEFPYVPEWLIKAIVMDHSFRGGGYHRKHLSFCNFVFPNRLLLQSHFV